MELRELADRSEQARERVNSEFGSSDKRMAIVPGTGWKYAIQGHEESGLAAILDVKQELPYSELGIPGIDGKVEGHTKSLKLGEINGEEVFVAGRVHANENVSNPDIVFSTRMIVESIREQVLGMMITNGAGTLDGKVDTGKGWIVDTLVNWAFKTGATIIRGGKRPAEVQPGDIAIIEDVVSLLVGRNTPLISGEFKDPYNQGIKMDDGAYYELGRGILKQIQGKSPEAIYTMVTGPQFEGPQDKRILKLISDLVGMSTLIEILLATRYEIPFIAMSLATNGPFVVHDHSDNDEMGVQQADKAQRIIEATVDKFPQLVKEIKAEKRRIFPEFPGLPF